MSLGLHEIWVLSPFTYRHKKSVETSVVRSTSRGSSIAFKVEQTTSEPTPIWYIPPVQQLYGMRIRPSYDCRNGYWIPQALLAREVGIEKSYPRASTVAMFKTLIGEFGRFDSSWTKRQVNAFNMSLNYVSHPTSTCFASWFFASRRCCSA